MKLGNLTRASMLTTIRDMLGFKKMTEIIASGGGASAKDIAQLNRLLNKIKK